MKKNILLLFCSVILITAKAQQYIYEGRKSLAVIPVKTRADSKPVTCLNGTWEINLTPLSEQWNKPEGNWKKIQVPGEPAMQGYRVANDVEFFYRTTIAIPPSAKNNTTIIRFNAVYSYARVYVNGHFVREHFGGFTAWDADISAYIEPGKTATIHVGVTDRADDISYASGYAFHPIGGILREVQLLLLPKDFINRLYVQTNLVRNFKEATISINIAKSISSGSNKINIQLLDANGNKVFAKDQSFTLDNEGKGKYSANVKNLVLWNQEKPYLYTLKVELIANGQTDELVEQKIGFRKLQVDGKRLLVNGDPVKLRGACRHDMHPLYGRSTNRYYDSLDIVLAKEANLNFIRTSHYPPSQDFLEFADQYGIYVQEETAICFVNDWRTGVYNKVGETNNDTAYTARYLGQLSEMLDRDRNHASVIMWSIGNESNYGINFQKEYDFVKSVDSSRPVSWSWPGSAIKENKRCFDIAVAHYPGFDGKDSENFGLHYYNMEHESLPLLSDEWAHVPCYNQTLLRLDPNVKDFWGRSLDSMWANRFDIQGNLGGAIWGMTDETFQLPDTTTGYGPWGIIDVWRRRKAEFWNAKKSYSPVRVLQTHFNNVQIGDTLHIPVQNRFNHLVFNQIKLKIIQKGKSSFGLLPSLKPHETGMISIKIANTKSPVLLEFIDEKSNLIDEELISFSESKIVQAHPNLHWVIYKNEDAVILKSNNLSVQLDANTGQLLFASLNGKTILNGGIRVIINRPKEPHAFKESVAVFSGDYKVSNVTINTDNKNEVVVTSQGLVNHYPVKMISSYFADGTIETAYVADSIPPYTWQVGVSFPLSNSIDAIQWKRNGYWTIYPDNHLSTNSGMAKRYTNISEHYRSAPNYEVSQSWFDYYLTGSIVAENASMYGSEAYRSAKENIISLQLLSKGKSKIQINGNGSQAAKINILNRDQQELVVMDKWGYWTLSWGNFAGSKNKVTLIEGRTVIKLIK